MTGLTYDNRDQAQEDRRQQERLLEALGAAPAQLRRDEAGWWVIAGQRGTIQTWGDGRTWLVYVRCRSPQHWTFTKRRLVFMTVTQDGDEEGCLRLFQIPAPHEAVVIRDVMGLRRRVDYAPEALERKRASMARAGLARGAASPTVPGVAMPDEVSERFPPEGGPAVEGPEVLFGTSLIAVGVKGRFQAQGAAMAPALVPETLPNPSREEFAAKASISAASAAEPEESA